MTQPGHEPSKDWLAFVKTSRARNKIKHVINASERVKAIEIGQKYLEKEARRLGVQLSKVAKSGPGARGAASTGYSKMEDLYAGARLRQVFRAAGAAEDRARTLVTGRAPSRRLPARTLARRHARTSRTIATPSSRCAASTTCWSIAPSAAIRSAAKRSSAT